MTEGARLSDLLPAALKRREQFVTELEEKYKQGEEPRVRSGLFLESDRTWVTQLTDVARERRILTCAIASFQNALRSLGAYNQETDSQEQLVHEVEDLFREGGGSEITALDRLVRNRAAKGMQMHVVNFQGAMEALLDGKVAVHGNAGHMVFLQRVEARKNPQTQEIEIGVRKIDPLQQVVRSEFTPLRELAREVPTYRVFSISQPSSRLRLPTRR